MKKLMIIGFLLAVLVTPAAATTLYVQGDSVVNLRNGNSTRHKVIDTIDPGRAIEVIEKSNNWTKVRLPDGKEGWIVSRLLTDKKPADVIEYELNNKIDNLSSESESLQAENERLIIENQALHEKLEETLELMTETRTAHDALIAESADFLTLKADHERLVNQLGEKTEIISSLETKLAITHRSLMIYWFLAGAGVLLLGIIIGAATKPKRTKFI
jgi:SH3 domain protein